jgi:hypothetical protein
MRASRGTIEQGQFGKHPTVPVVDTADQLGGGPHVALNDFFSEQGHGVSIIRYDEPFTLAMNISGDDQLSDFTGPLTRLLVEVGGQIVNSK